LFPLYLLPVCWFWYMLKPVFDFKVYPHFLSSSSSSPSVPLLCLAAHWYSSTILSKTHPHYIKLRNSLLPSLSLTAHYYMTNTWHAGVMHIVPAMYSIHFQNFKFWHDISSFSNRLEVPYCHMS
jgi:hypothetical protein